MKISVIIAHPSKQSFNHAIAATCVTALKENGYHVIVHDLYDEQFDALLPYAECKRNASLPIDIERHCREIAEAFGIIIIHPNWWGMPPAILTGWVDRVLRPGVAYEFLESDKGEGVPRGLLTAQCGVVFNTSNTETTREKTVFLDPLETLWKNCIFGLCGVKSFYRRMFNIIITSTQAQREDWLSEVAATVNRVFPKGL
jgi:NAD(P)H dehydrogenase (quinone)